MSLKGRLPNIPTSSLRRLVTALALTSNFLPPTLYRLLPSSSTTEIGPSTSTAPNSIDFLCLRSEFLTCLVLPLAKTRPLTFLPSRLSARNRKPWMTFPNGTSMVPRLGKPQAITPMSTSDRLQCTPTQLDWATTSWLCVRPGILMEHQTSTTSAMKLRG